MRLKTNLHFHTAEDPHDLVGYTLKEGIDHASSLGFEVLAVTCHNYFAWTKEHAEYAEEKGILLIPGIELTIAEEKKLKRNGYRKGYHTLVINADKDAEDIFTFDDLKEYRKKRGGEIAVIAAHPYFYGNFSLKGYLEKYVNLYDAVEHSWYYSRVFNRNKKAMRFALKNELPFVATSDTHYLYNNHMDRNYAYLDTDEKTIEATVNAIKNGDIENVTKPSNTIRDMILLQIWFEISKLVKKRKR
ncbi:MAG: PHP domain-containing protein [Candidatus Spechtbacterales bacterium]